jgi:hypothetical protein
MKYRSNRTIFKVAIAMSKIKERNELKQKISKFV